MWFWFIYGACFGALFGVLGGWYWAVCQARAGGGASGAVLKGGREGDVGWGEARARFDGEAGAEDLHGEAPVGESKQ